MFFSKSNKFCCTSLSLFFILFWQYSFAQCSITSPTATGDCSYGSSSLNLSVSGSTGYYNWYSASTGGTPEFTGDSVATPVLASTTTYYVSALDTSTALKLDGSNDYVALNYNFNGSGILSAFTAEAWVRTTYVGGGYSGNWAILDFDRSEYFDLYVRGDNGEVGFSTKGASTGIDDFYSTGNSVNDGQWHQIAAQFTGTDKVIYIDGSEVARKTGVHPNGIGSGTNRYGFIGDGSEASSFNANRNNIYYDGEVDEVRYWNVARTATEIHDWKDSVITTIPASLLLYYPMNEGTGTTVKNVAGPTGDGTMYNFNASTAWVKGSPVSYRCESARTPVTGTISSSSLQSGLLDCNVNSVSLDAGAGYSSYTWNTGATSRTITASEPGIYRVTVTGGACGGSRSVSVAGNTHSETSLNFDGNNDKGAIEGLSYEGTNYSTLTFETWIKTSKPGNQIIASFDRSEYWILEINGEGGAGNGKIGFDILTSTGQVDMGGNTNIADGKWHHIAAVFDNGNFTIYVDGIVDGTATGGTTFGTGHLRYGFLGVGSEASAYNCTTGPNNYFLGELDEFRIWEVARSETEIRDNMVQQMQTIEPGLVAYYKFDEPNGTLFMIMKPINPTMLIYLISQPHLE